MASICNDERAALGVMSGHDRKTLRLSSTFQRIERECGKAELKQHPECLKWRSEQEKKARSDAG